MNHTNVNEHGNHRKHRLGACLGAALLSASTLHTSIAHSAQVPISDLPLFLGISVRPNVFFQSDDSGSMNWEISVSQYWRACDYDSNAPGGRAGNADCFTQRHDDEGLFEGWNGSSYRTFPSMFQTPDAWTPIVENNQQDVLDEDWRVFSSAFNKVYFDHRVDYEPWPGEPDQSFANTGNQTGHASGSDERDMEGFTFVIWEDDRGYTGDRPHRGTNINATDTPNGEVDLWDSHRIVTFTDDDEISITEVSYDPDPAVPSLNRSTNTIDEIESGEVVNHLGVTLSELKANVANWYAYGRRRSFVAAAAIGDVLQAQPNFRYGLNSINNDVFVEVPTATSGDFTSHNDALYADLKANHPGGGTPLRNGLDRVGQYYSDNLSGTDDPIVHECQKNFSIVMSDGFWNGGDPGVGEVDGDGFDDTLADVARHYYETDLSPLPNEVPPDPADPADWQHMVTFTVAFGLTGTLTDTDGDGWPDPQLAMDDVWGGEPVAFSNTTVDDMWHAAFNSKGKFLAAQTPSALTKSLAEALETVAERDSSAAAVAVNSGSFQTGSKLFQARFNSNDWSGDLLAFELEERTSPQDPTLKLVFPKDTPEWKAAELLDGRNPDDRDIITYKPTLETGIPFEWPTNPSSPTAGELDLSQINALNTNPDSGLLDARGDERLAYLRGDQANEVANGGDFRTRASVLGDLVNSAPVFVGDPSFLYPEEWPGASPPETSYSAFIQAQEGRTPMVYVGGNDGMLHGFNADTGQEAFAYVPDALYENLSELTSQNYTHKFFADGSPTYTDVFFNNDWHSVITSGLRKGGQAVFALEVTDPSALSDGNANDIVLWEFGDSDTDADGAVEGDADLGYSFSQPSVVRLYNGEWAAVFGNGYNNTAADGNASTTGNAVLYVVNIETGELIRKIDTGVGTADDPQGNNRPNGLATPAVVDVDSDFVADFAFAGDLFGNLWKFDLRDPNPTNWGSYVESGTDPAPMFTTESPDSGGPPQPITVRPQVGFHPAGRQGLMIYFGTGKYIGSEDNTQTDQTTQSFYAVWDRTDRNGNQNLFDRSQLLLQTIDAEVAVTRTSGFSGDDVESELRVTSNNDIPAWFDGQGSSSGEFAGWVIDLIDPDDGLNHGEKAVTNPRLRGDRIIFTTLIPSTSPCQFGGDSWLMELATSDGGRLGEPVFDLNEDAAFGADDMTDGGVIPSGLKSSKGIFSEATILQVPAGEMKLMSTSSGEIATIGENPGDEDSGRQSWEELK